MRTTLFLRYLFVYDGKRCSPFFILLVYSIIPFLFLFTTNKYYGEFMFHDGFMNGMGYNWIIWLAVIALIVFLIIRLTNQNKK